MADDDGSPPLVPRSPGGDWGRPHHAADPRRILRLPLVALAPFLVFLHPSGATSESDPIARRSFWGRSQPGQSRGLCRFLRQRTNPPSDATSDSARLRVTAREQPQNSPFFLKYNRIQFPFSEQIRIRSWPPQIRGRIRGEASGGGPAICEHGPAPESFGTGTSLPPILSSRKHREKKTVRIHLQMFRN